MKMHRLLLSVLLFCSSAIAVTTPPTAPQYIQIPWSSTIRMSAKYATSYKIVVNTLVGNTTIAAPTDITDAGKIITFYFKQDGTGGRTVTWDAVFDTTWSDAGNLANARSSVSFFWDRTKWREESYSPWSFGSRLANPSSVTYSGKQQNINPSTTPAFDPSQGETINFTLGGSDVSSWTITSGLEGQVVTLRFIQPSQFGHRKLYGTPSNVVLKGPGTIFPLSNAVNSVDTLTLRWDSSASKWYEVARTSAEVGTSPAIYNVKDFGATGYGASNDDTYIQAAITAAAPSAHVYLPCGHYRVSQTIVLDSVSGLVIEGAGTDCTELDWVGSAGLPVIKIINSYRPHLHHFKINGYYLGSNKAGIGIESHVDAAWPTSASPISRNEFDHLEITAVTKGIAYTAAAASDFNNDFGTFDHVIVYSDTINFSFEHTQSMGHTLIECKALQGQYGVAVGLGTPPGGITSGGSFTWHGGAIGTHSIADFYVTCGPPNHISGGVSEGSNRLLVSPGPAFCTAPTTVEGMRWSADGLNSDNHMIYFQTSGPLIVKGNLFDSQDPINDKPGDILVAASYAHIEATGNAWVGHHSSTFVPVTWGGIGPVSIRRDGNMIGPGPYEPNAVSFSATPTFDTAINGQVIDFTLTDNVTSWVLTDSGGVGGVAGYGYDDERVTIRFIQDGTGSHTLAGTPANVKLAGGALTLSTGANKIDAVTFQWDTTSGKWVEISRSLNL